jgi:hypothetical protein
MPRRDIRIDEIPQRTRHLASGEALRMLKQQMQQLFHGLCSRQELYLMSRQIPYSPMHEPRKEVSLDQMNRILAKHSGPKEVSRETIPEVAEPPKSVHPPLEWERPKSRDQMALMTKCGQYTCCKIVLNKRVTYECWALVPGVWFAQVAIGLPSFDAAKTVAQKHADAKWGKQ